ncbi:MAG TPA: acyl-CoA thioesterase [Alphaproteobacteria bacterium]|mgnify:FL=1|jgi:acyl-CoA thioesterase YciA|nr:acyl-CoA thioesterase [Alphaproteobacteria bacterium]|tara:strand:- start:1598 stop:1987 length:390 start_codon:yes stop_codon:yes gene_type:complete
MPSNLINKVPSIRAVAMPADTNPSGDIFGGWVLSQMDLAGSVLARQITKNRVTTIAVDKMRFHKPIMIGDIVSFYTEVSKIGNTSITIDIVTMVNRKDEKLGEDQAIIVTEGKFVYVSIDSKGKPIKIE